MAYDFPIPKGYVVPEGLNEGETFEDIASFRLQKDGKICLTKIGDSSILEDGKEDKSEPDDYGTAEGMESRLTTAYKERNLNG